MHEHSSSRGRRVRGAGTIALSLGLCLCAGQLIASSPASAATATPITAAAASAKVRPVVKTTYSTRKVKAGASIKVTAKYINPANGKVVTSGLVRLQAFRKGKWVNQTSKKLGSSGTAALSFKPGASGYLRAVYAGSSKFTSLAGGKTYVSVVPNGNKIINEAKKHVGSLYKFGAAGPTRFDCSGYTMYVYKKTIGKSLPHKANSQQKYGKSVSKGNKQIGDLIIFRNGSYGYHAGIYAGSGYMYDSPHTGARVSKRKMIGSNYVVRRLT
ncbi:NlpC/P60 family protein [Actinoplanes sp. Pm04-4]|uniref:NlpC/P60 family protein n=1 Tax=Paractinoplanes pyxinae TaxID=2997416 RepID=A0ABT4AWS6_9ACTN|nr:NlpC/P60 family protein [Actinoplanes pyxinae]MCY1138676.1 NlpC/P60 family protein [Actinoplanes pyxinae]